MQNPRSYADRLSRVIDYIHAHLDDDLDLNRLADIACLSPYHWHRIYHAFYGETASATVRRLRLHRAAGELTRSDTRVDVIATRAGYTSVQAFTRAFQASYRMPQAQFRLEGGADRWQSVPSDPIQSGGHIMHHVEIRTRAALTVAAIDHRGSYLDIGRAFEQLFRWCTLHASVDPAARMAGVYLDDPSIVPEADLRSRACMEIPANADIAFDQHVSRMDIAGGEFAVLTHIGPYTQLEFAYRWLYGDWLPTAPYQAANEPVHEIYLNNPRDTAPADLVTEIWLPIVA